MSGENSEVLTIGGDSSEAQKAISDFQTKLVQMPRVVDDANQRMTGGWKKSGDELQRVRRHMDDTHKGSSSLARGLGELGRGASDAASQFGTQGFAGALRGSMNNLEQFAFVVGGPAVGALVALGGAALQTAIPLFDVGKKGKEAADTLAEAWKRAKEQMLDVEAAVRKLHKTQDAFTESTMRNKSDVAIATMEGARGESMARVTKAREALAKKQKENQEILDKTAQPARGFLEPKLRGHEAAARNEVLAAESELKGITEQLDNTKRKEGERRQGVWWAGQKERFGEAFAGVGKAFNAPAPDKSLSVQGRRAERRAGELQRELGDMRDEEGDTLRQIGPKNFRQQKATREDYARRREPLEDELRAAQKTAGQEKDAQAEANATAKESLAVLKQIVDALGSGAKAGAGFVIPVMHRPADH